MQVIRLDWLVDADKVKMYGPVIVNTDLLLNRIRLFGKFPSEDHDSPFLLIILDDSGYSVIDEFRISKEQHDWIKKSLKMRLCK